MVQNLKAYFILYVIKIKWIICVHEKAELLVCHKEQRGAQPALQEISSYLPTQSNN